MTNFVSIICGRNISFELPSGSNLALRHEAEARSWQPCYARGNTCLVLAGKPTKGVIAFLGSLMADERGRRGAGC